MAIENIRDNSVPMLLADTACTTASRQVTVPTEEQQGDDFVFCECEYVEKVFHSESGLDRENDFRSFLVELSDDTSTVVFNLVKGNTVTPLVDGLHGTLYPTRS